MESMHSSGSNVGMRTGASTNSGGGEQLNRQNKQVPSSSPFSPEFTSEDFFDFVPNATTTTTNARPLGASSPTHDQKYLHSELHQAYSVVNNGDGRPINSHSHVESDPAKPFFDLDPSPFPNNIAPSSPSQNPFLMMDDANTTSHSLPTMQQENGGMTNNGFPPSLGLSSYDSSQGIPFKPPTSSTSKKTSVSTSDLMKVDEHYYHENESHRLPSTEKSHWSMPSSSEARTHHSETHVSCSSRQLDPFKFESPLNLQKVDATSKNNSGATTIPTSVEPHHTFSVREEGQHSKTSSSSGTDNRFDSSSMPSFPPAYESSTQDYMHNSTSARPTKQGKDSRFASESGDDDIPISSFPRHGQQGSSGSEKQTPPLQVMERSEDPTKCSNYRFPSHVFSRHQSNTQWSTASNESLFSIQMGNTSFSSDLAWMSKSGDMDRPGDTNSSGVPPNNQPPPPLPPQSPPTKFNHISQSTANQHEGSRVTEEKAAETMREVIMENSINNEDTCKEESTTVCGPTRSERRSHNDSHSHRSDGSTKSFAFNVMTDGDRPLSSKHTENKRKQQKQPEPQNLKAASDAAAQNPKPTPNASNQNKSWLSCFPCCG
ncbi:hypothetical protein Fmac_008579 [Flemingia macrophylla]|uniref:Uncharacterized protein n=1 Tax=Flemingia macrophylla TaxID=520843 RepID=A0ABD1MXS5_9FABA